MVRYSLYSLLKLAQQGKGKVLHGQGSSRPLLGDMLAKIGSKNEWIGILMY
ncbi:hypothetical protein [uncultured Shewanella sp.]|uniref:hypothetical protein n=1 Tax=uncultured Shewanella sp. TaxID=173975 RepID=UPI0026311FF8|nr:hypothetical protein [uncultured Shewanella sp.]